jgi:hypothetical protein
VIAEMANPPNPNFGVCMKTNASTPLDSSSVAMRLGMCAAALAGVAAPVSNANAVVVTTFANTSIPVPANGDGVYLNFLNGATGTTSALAGWDINAFLGNAVFSFFWNNTAPSVSGGVASVATPAVYAALSVGDVISAASTFTAASSGGGPGSTINFQTAGTRILGFRFRNETTATTNFGYMSITNGATGGFPATINGWVYENNGGAITVVPEPATGVLLSMGALALGALNLRRIRRERRQLAS